MVKIYTFRPSRAIECLTLSIYYSFFLTGLLFIAIEKNIGDVLFLSLLLVFCLKIFKLSGLSNKVVLFILLYISVLLFSLSITVVKDIPVLLGVKQMFYYLKPLAFLVIGYLVLTRPFFEQYVKIIASFMFLGAFSFYLAPHFFIDSTLSKVGLAQEGVGYLYSFSSLIRNTTFLLSPLDSSFVMFFLSFHFFYKYFISWRKSYLAMFIASGITLLTTLTRSSLLALILAICIFIYLKSSMKKRIYIFFILICLIIGLGAYFNQELYFIFFIDGSASMHHDNLNEVLSHIANGYFLPSGLATSGWVTNGMPFNIYSEGSLFATIIENGFMFLVFYIVLFYSTYIYSRDYLFPIVCGYILAAMLIPIGFSTLFNLLFFSYLGICINEHFQEKRTLRNIRVTLQNN